MSTRANGPALQNGWTVETYTDTSGNPRIVFRCVKGPWRGCSAECAVYSAEFLYLRHPVRSSFGMIQNRSYLVPANGQSVDDMVEVLLTMCDNDGGCMTASYEEVHGNGTI